MWRCCYVFIILLYSFIRKIGKTVNWNPVYSIIKVIPIYNKTENPYEIDPTCSLLYFTVPFENWIEIWTGVQILILLKEF